MPTLWFCLVAVMLAMYVVFDGFDLGVGAVHRLVARTPEERRAVLRSIGPVWDGNEVWLLAAGGTLYFAFPALYAASFSGFYLPLMMVLWMLMGRGISLEFYEHVESPVWRSFWDGIFVISSALLCVFFGAALGNVVRGVPLDASGRFFLPMWVNFHLGPPSGILDWYTILIGVAALAALALHGALWIALKVDGEVEVRARKLAALVWWAVLGLTLLVTAASFYVQPRLRIHLSESPWIGVFPVIALAGLGACRLFLARRPGRAFLSSCGYLIGMLCSAAFGLYPYVLPARPDAALSFTAQGVAAPVYGLKIGLAWWIPGMVLVTIYFVFMYRRLAGKIAVEQTES